MEVRLAVHPEVDCGCGVTCACIAVILKVHVPAWSAVLLQEMQHVADEILGDNHCIVFCSSRDEFLHSDNVRNVS